MEKVRTRRLARQNSNIFQMLTTQQMSQLREAFNFIDKGGIGKITEDSLFNFLESVGFPSSDEVIQSMVKDLGTSGCFMSLITAIGERMSQTDSITALTEALTVFDEDGSGFVRYDELKLWLTEKVEDKLTVDDYNYIVRGCDDNGMININKLVQKLKHGEILQ